MTVVWLLEIFEWKWMIVDKHGWIWMKVGWTCMIMNKLDENPKFFHIMQDNFYIDVPLVTNLHNFWINASYGF